MSDAINTEAPPEEWAYAEDLLPKVAEHPVRELLTMQLERDRTAWQQRSRYTKRFDKFVDGIKAFTDDVTKKFFVLFENDVSQMKATKRLEKSVDSLHSKLDILIGDARVSQAEIRTLKESQSAAMSAASAERLERIADQRRIVVTEALIEAMRKDVTASGQHAAVGEALAREALGSIHEKDDEKKDLREDKREDKRKRWELIMYVAKWALGLISLVVATWLTVHYGLKGPSLPAPPGAAHHEGHHE